MAEPTDPAEVAALQAYDNAYGKLVDLQENLPDADVEGAVDAWVLNVHSLWKILRLNWARAGISSRAWRGVETTLVETLPNIHEDGISVAFVEYNELVARVVRLFFSSFLYLADSLSFVETIQYQALSFAYPGFASVQANSCTSSGFTSLFEPSPNTSKVCGTTNYSSCTDPF